MDLPNLLPGETVLLNWPDSGILITNKRVRTLHRNRRTGAQKLGSVMLSDICCCTAEKVKLRWLLSAAILWAALGFYFRHEALALAGKPVQGSYWWLTWGFFLAAAAFLGLYIVVRRRTVRIYAPAGVLEWCVPLRPPISAEGVIGVIEATKEQQRRLAAPPPTHPSDSPREESFCRAPCCRTEDNAPTKDAAETARLVSLGVATLPADIVEPLGATALPEEPTHP